MHAVSIATAQLHQLWTRRTSVATPAWGRERSTRERIWTGGAAGLRRIVRRRIAQVGRDARAVPFRMERSRPVRLHRACWKQGARTADAPTPATEGGLHFLSAARFRTHTMDAMFDTTDPTAPTQAAVALETGPRRIERTWRTPTRVSQQGACLSSRGGRRRESAGMSQRSGLQG